MMIQTKNLSKSFGGFQAVQDLNLQVKKGRVYGFLGPNGAGKSTTIRMLLGLIKPTKGETKIFGKNLDVNKMGILRKIGSMVEAPSYYGQLTAYENLRITAKLLDLNESHIEEVLDTVKLSKWRNKQVKKFSLGMKQRLGIAQALIGKPKLLILDEPTNGLDPSGIHEIRQLIRSLPKNDDMTVVISSHILSEIELMADDIGIIHKGKLLFQGTLNELHNRSKGQICIGANNLYETMERIRNHGYIASIKDNHIWVKTQQEPLDQMLKQLILEGSQIYQFVEKQKTLEQIFLDLTEEGKAI